MMKRRGAVNLMMLVFAAGLYSAHAVEPIHLKSDIVYKTTPEGDLHLDMFYPEAEPTGTYPVVIYTHGGGWVTGSKEKVRGRRKMGRVVRGLTEKGFCVAAVNYRLVKHGGNTSMRDCVIDAKDAIRFLVKNKEDLFVDPDRVFTFGDSAGGQIAQMLLLSSPESLSGAKDLADYKYKVVAGVSWYGPCDFENIELFRPEGSGKVRDRFGARIIPANADSADKLRLYREMSPVNYLASESPPLLMIQGDRDTTIPVHHAYYMDERAEQIGAPVDILIIENAGHNWREADQGVAIEPPLATIVERTVEFLVGHL